MGSPIIIPIAVRYSCHECGLKDISVNVPARHEEQNLDSWMGDLLCRLGCDHFNRSPHCRTMTLSEVKIPIDSKKENVRVGDPTGH